MTILENNSVSALGFNCILFLSADLWVFYIIISYRCRSICEKFDYQVEITGIGEGPPGSEKLGFCSQAAVFTQHLWSSSVDPKGSLCYQLVRNDGNVMFF